VTFGITAATCTESSHQLLTYSKPKAQVPYQTSVIHLVA